MPVELVRPFEHRVMTNVLHEHRVEIGLDLPDRVNVRRIEVAVV